MGWDGAVREQDGRVTVEVRAKPGSKREGVGVEGDRVVVRVSARAVEGKANRRILEVVAQALGIKRRQVRLVRGETSREKLLELEGVDRNAVIQALSDRLA